MKNRQSSFGQKKLSLLDKVIYRMRLGRILRGADFRDKIVADTGCGFNYRFLRSVAGTIGKGYAVDVSLNSENRVENVELALGDLNREIALPDSTIDIVTSMAILEHLSEPEAYLREVFRVLKPGWRLVMTVPSVWSKPVLEFLAYRLRVIAEDEIRDHKTYYDRAKLVSALVRAGFDLKKIRHSYFQLGMNNFLTAEK